MYHQMLISMLTPSNVTEAFPSIPHAKLRLLFSLYRHLLIILKAFAALIAKKMFGSK